MKNKLAKFLMLGMVVSMLSPMSAFAESVGITEDVSSSRAIERKVIDRDNYGGQYNRLNGCWLACARNLVVGQVNNKSKDSKTTIEKQLTTVCRAVKNTSADVPDNGDRYIVMALEEFDSMMGSGRHSYDTTNANADKKFDFLFKKITSKGYPVIISLGRAKSREVVEGHNVLVTGVDNGTNKQEVVRVHNPSDERQTWIQAYDLERGQASALKNRAWLSSVYCSR